MISSELASYLMEANACRYSFFSKSYSVYWLLKSGCSFMKSSSFCQSSSWNFFVTLMTPSSSSW